MSTFFLSETTVRTLTLLTITNEVSLSSRGNYITKYLHLFEC